MRWWRILSFPLLVMPFVLPSQAEQTRLRIAVLAPGSVPSSAEAGSSAGVEWAAALAEELATWEALEVVGPSEEEMPAAAVEQATALRDWAEQAGFGAVILCESSPQQSEAAICDLRSGHSGASLNRYTVGSGEGDGSPSPASVDGVVASIRNDLEAGQGGLLLPAVSADQDSPKGGAESSMPIFDRDLPIRIESDELDVITEGKARRLIFNDNVHVEQGDIQLYTAYLEAFYPAGASQPERLEASGGVRVIEKDREVRCKKATYRRTEGLVICRGDAILVQGCDEVRGSEIEFDLIREKVRVIGAATVVLQPEKETDPDCKESTG